MKIYCCECKSDIEARLTDGKAIYSHRPDLHNLPFWKCDICGNHVGCHHKTKDRTRPLGHIPSPEISNARRHIHAKLDPLWKTGKYARKFVYAYISDLIGWKYHTAKIKTVDEARDVYRYVKRLTKGYADPNSKTTK